MMVQQDMLLQEINADKLFDPLRVKKRPVPLLPKC